MNNDREDKIRRRAYEIWEREGRTGNPEDHWVRAERELRDTPLESGGIAVEDTARRRRRGGRLRDPLAAARADGTDFGENVSD